LYFNVSSRDFKISKEAAINNQGGLCACLKDSTDLSIKCDIILDKESKTKNCIKCDRYSVSFYDILNLV
jgi:hypothetical protein